MLFTVLPAKKQINTGMGTTVTAQVWINENTVLPEGRTGSADGKK